MADNGRFVIKKILLFLKWLKKDIYLNFYCIFKNERGNFVIKDVSDESYGYVKSISFDKLSWTKRTSNARIFYSNSEAMRWIYFLNNQSFCKIINLFPIIENKKEVLK